MRVSAGYLERVAREWQRAYERANGKVAPVVMWSKGWFDIDGVRYRRRTLEDMTNTLRRVAELSQADRSEDNS